MTQPPTGQDPSLRGRGSAGTPPRPRLRRVSRALRPQLVQLLGTLLFVFLVYQGIIVYWNTTAPREVTIPKVGGLREEEAVNVLKATELKAEIVARKYDERVPEGVVMVVDPKPGRHVKAGRSVRLIISEGSRWAKVPDVQQMSRDRALALIKDAKLTVGKESASYHDKIPIGYVITQTPAAGVKVSRNTAVNVTLSRGPETPSEDLDNGSNESTGVHSYDVEFVIPPGPTLQDLRIVVTDSTGEHEVYHQSHQAGEVVRRRVTGQGADAVVQIYVSGNLAEEHNFPPR